MEANNYELMIIGNPKVDSEAILSVVDSAMKEVSATSVKVDKLGRKLLAYPIAKQTEGEYIVFNFEADGGAIAQIVGKLKLSQETILRYLITKVESDSTKAPESKSLKVEAREEIEETGKATGPKTEGDKKRTKSKVKVKVKTALKK